MTTAAPFLRWPGGKRWLAADIARLYSEVDHRRYVEPFLGGGAIFFQLTPRRAHLSDINDELINAFAQVRDAPEALERRLRKLAVDAASYERIRQSHPTTPLGRAVRFLYLNRTAFSGIYRVNRSNEFNVPFGGGQRRPDFLWESGVLSRASAALKGAHLRSRDFSRTLAMVRKGDFVYCDPTYTVMHDNNGFIRYNEKNFSWADQERLARAAEAARARGATVVVTNAHHDQVAALYSSFKANVITRRSNLARDPAHRREVSELLLIGRPA